MMLEEGFNEKKIGNSQQNASNGHKLTPSETKERNELLNQMEENGDLERLKHDLFAQLVLHEPWRENMQRHTQAVVQEQGVSEVTLDELSLILTACGSRTIPESIKQYMLQKIGQIVD
mmetsp:Transcript_18718/g.30176  ORF Transcript_18718/g.30176 Transcript_18718/m.30176 type:complete len:118 (-) Transcript_18718:122-475(-)